MANTPKHTSWPDTIAKIKQQMLAYRLSDDPKIYSIGEERIDVPLPLEEFTTPTSKRNIHCYAATAADSSSWPPCPGDYLVMQHPLMVGGFTTALRKEKVLEEFYDDNFMLPEDRFVRTRYENVPYNYNFERFENFSPKLRDHYIGFRGIFVIYGLYSPYHQTWVDNAAPRECFFMNQFLYNCSGRSNRQWDYINALLRFDFMPETTDLLRRQEDQLVFPRHSGIVEKIGFNQTYSSYYIIVESPKIEHHHDWMR